MDVFNTFLLANLIGCAAVALVAIDPLTRARKWIAKINVAGVSGALIGAGTVTLVAQHFI